jgi:hypothetical protein
MGRTNAGRPKISCPRFVRSMAVTLTSQPPALRPTLTPIARPTIWWPKQTPMIRTRSCARTCLVNSTSLTIHGVSSKELYLEPVINMASISSRSGYSCASTTSKFVRTRPCFEDMCGWFKPSAPAESRALKTPPYPPYLAAVPVRGVSHSRTAMRRRGRHMMGRELTRRCRSPQCTEDI